MKRTRNPAAGKRPGDPIEAYSGSPGCRSCIQQVLDAVPVPIFLKDAAFRYLGCNSSFSSFTGLTLKKLSGRTVYDIAPESLARMYDRMDRDLMKKGGRQTYQWQVADAKGLPRDVIYDKTAVRAPGGKAAGIIGAMIDITELLRARDRAEEKTRMLETMIAGLPGMVYRCRDDASWTMIYASGGCLALTGYRPEDLVMNARLSYDDLIHPSDRALVRHEISSGVENGKPFRIEYRIITAAGDEKWVAEHGTPVRASSGKTIFLEGFISDISGARELEESRRELGQLGKLLTVCSGCRKIKGSGGFWEKFENYFQQHAGASFSHGLCDACAGELYGPGGKKAASRPKKIRGAKKGS